MTRSDLARRLADRNPHLRLKDAKSVVDTIFSRIEEALAAADRVELRDFGSFTAKQREARTSRNRQTGERVDVPSKVDVHFKASKAMRERLNAEPAPAAMAAE